MAIYEFGRDFCPSHTVSLGISTPENLLDFREHDRRNCAENFPSQHRVMSTIAISSIFKRIYITRRLHFPYLCRILPRKDVTKILNVSMSILIDYFLRAIYMKQLELYTKPHQTAKISTFLVEYFDSRVVALDYPFPSSNDVI
ncbi:hypothetical protein AVEN_91115-1 [Araneus ventricosus]|uniref:Uncharacterized protein n=1 Tax=Araneus ventricosus TaxID=182803 RepID=A0A4Y2QGW8_ARAVE|nr:hypothetical protein AVEN_91115-1 [Araneus ventricosus]